MRKNDIADYVVSNTNLTKSQALEAVECVFNAISDSLCKGESVFLRGFATFKVHRSKERKARNISKGTTISIPSQRTAKLVLGKELKNRLNK